MEKGRRVKVPTRDARLPAVTYVAFGGLMAFVVALLMGAAALPNYERNNFTTNVAGRPYGQNSNIVISNFTQTITWKFFGNESNTVARLGDITNIAGVTTNGLATTNYVDTAATNRIFIAATNGAVVHSNFSGNTVTYRIGATNVGGGEHGLQTNSWTTNVAGTAVVGAGNLSITNGSSGTNWQFFGITSNTVARIGDITNIITSYTNELATTNFVLTTVTNNVAVAPTNGIRVHTNRSGFSVTYTVGTSNETDIGFAALEIQTNGVRLGLVTNVNWTAGVTGSVSGSTATIGTTGGGASLSGTTNFMNLSVQAAKLPTTNYAGIDAGWQAWEDVFSETNAEGSRATLNASWQFMVPPDYATNSLKLLINYSLLNTNGPNVSNVVWGASVLVARSGTTNNIHTNLFGSVVKGSNDWIASYDGTNRVTNLVINLDTSSLLMPRDVAVLKLERYATEDTYGGAVSLHGLQVEYTRP